MEEDPLARITHRLEYFDNLESSEDADWLLWQVRDQRERIERLEAALVEREAWSRMWRDACDTSDWLREPYPSEYDFRMAREFLQDEGIIQTAVQTSVNQVTS